MTEEEASDIRKSKTNSKSKRRLVEHGYVPETAEMALAKKNRP